VSPNFLVSTALALLVVVPASALVGQGNARPTNAASASSVNACVVDDNIGPNGPVHDPTFLAPASFPQSPLSIWRCARATGDSPTWNRAPQSLGAQGPKNSVTSRTNGVATTEGRAASSETPSGQGERKPAGSGASPRDLERISPAESLAAHTEQGAGKASTSAGATTAGTREPDDTTGTNHAAAVAARANPDSSAAAKTSGLIPRRE
jgi:hypothetical protein